MPVKFPDHSLTKLQTLVTAPFSQRRYFCLTPPHTPGPLDLGTWVNSLDPIPRERQDELRLSVDS